MKSSKLCGIAAALLLAATGASAADAVNPYVHSSSGQVVKNSTDLCWRTGFWTPALAEAWVLTALAALAMRHPRQAGLHGC